MSWRWGTACRLGDPPAFALQGVAHPDSHPMPSPSRSKPRSSCQHRTGPHLRREGLPQGSRSVERGISSRRCVPRQCCVPGPRPTRRASTDRSRGRSVLGEGRRVGTRRQRPLRLVAEVAAPGSSDRTMSATSRAGITHRRQRHSRRPGSRWTRAPPITPRVVV